MRSRSLARRTSIVTEIVVMAFAAVKNRSCRTVPTVQMSTTRPSTTRRDAKDPVPHVACAGTSLSGNIALSACMKRAMPSTRLRNHL